MWRVVVRRWDDMGGCRANGGVLCGSWDILQVSFCWPWGGGEQSGRRRRSSPLRKRHDKQSSKEQTRRVTDSDTVISTARLTAIFRHLSYGRESYFPDTQVCRVRVASREVTSRVSRHRHRRESQQDDQGTEPRNGDITTHEPETTRHGTRYGSSSSSTALLHLLPAGPREL